MRNLAFILLISIFSLTAITQTPGQIVAKKDPAAASSKKGVSGNESEEYQKAVSQIYPAERIKALQKFVEDFPDSENRNRALELIVSSRAALADEKLRANDIKGGVELFKLAIIEAPTPVSDKLFSEVILQIPTNLFYRGQSDEAMEVAKLIEAKAEGNPQQLLGVATFYLGTEHGGSAKRLAEEALEISPDLAAAYQTLGLANRINFDLQESTDAYAKALELDPNSIISKRSLAEMKRATGKAEEAVTLFREILEINPVDASAQTGLVLSLFNTGDKAEAEKEMTKAFEQNPRNLFLLVGAAYWYAANGQGAKAVEFAERAVTIEPRYTWAQIALARGLIAQKRPLDAEKALLTARQYGNFPTLNYEIASARMEAGLFREAAEELKKSFVVRDGKILTYLGGRIFKDADNFTELLEAERRASIFEPNPANSPKTAEKLKALLKFNQELEAPEVAETKVTEAIDEFVAGDDNMKLHRELFAANQLLDRKIALPKALQLTEAATGGVDAALDVMSPSSVVLADEIYQGRQLAFSRNEILVVPEIPRQTLSKILRGRIEEITGWALYQQDNKGEAIKRLRRAVSVLPEKSAWWRSSMWRLGVALEGEGKEKEALDAYLGSYDKEAQTQGKRFVIELLYRKINGNLDGLDKLIGENPFVESTPDDEQTVAQNTEVKAVAEPTPTPAPTPKIPNRVPVAEIVKPKPVDSDNIGAELKTDVQADSTQQTQKPSDKSVLEIQNTNKDVETVNMNEVVNDLKALLAKSQPEESTEVEPTPSPTPEEVQPTPSSTPEEAEVQPIPGPTPEDVDVKPTPSPTPEELGIQPTSSPTPETSDLKEDVPITEPTPSPTPVQVPADSDLSAEAEEKKPFDINIPAKSDTEIVPSPTPETENETVADNENVLTTEIPDPPTEKPKDSSEEKVVQKPGEDFGVEARTAKLSKPLFEPIIIKVPKDKRTSNLETGKQNTGIVLPENAETANPESENKPEKDTSEKSIDSSTTRPRVVITDNKPASNDPPPAEEIKPCKIQASQENLALINSGGSMVILISVDDNKDLSELKASTNSPDNIKIIFEPEIGGSSGQAIFIIKSISAKKGEYTVTFEAPCGKKEVSVKVR